MFLFSLPKHAHASSTRCLQDGMFPFQKFESHRPSPPHKTPIRKCDADRAAVHPAKHRSSSTAGLESCLGWDRHFATLRSVADVQKR